MREELAHQAGADFHFGLTSRSDVARVAELRFPSVPPLLDDTVAGRANASVGLGRWDSWERLSADIPAGVGLANGRSIARLCAIFAMGGTLDGVRYLSREMVAQATTEQLYVEDETFGWLRLGLGFGLHSETFAAPTPSSFHWGGYGGSWGLMDPKAGLSLGFAPNDLTVAAPDSILTLDPRLDRFTQVLAELIPTL